MKVQFEKFSSSSKFIFDALVIFENKPSAAKKSSKSQSKYSNNFQKIDKEFGFLLSESINRDGFDFDLAGISVITLSSQNKIPAKYKSIKKIFLVGMGLEETDSNDKAYRKVYSTLTRKVKSESIEKLAIFQPAKPGLLVEIVLLVDYEFTKYKSQDEKSKSKKKKLTEIRIFADDFTAQDKKAIKNALVIAEATNKARDLVWEPACEVTPGYLAETALKLDQKIVKVSIKEASECKKLGMGAFLAVAQGSDQPPKFIEFSYKPSGKIKKHLALIGKGVTFDSGGLSLKPAKSMEMMKEDMSGAAAIIGIMHAISKLQPVGIQITAIIAATENMPNGRAYRPGDVITAMNGKTIEVNNTDAEGRLTLADAVAYVSTKAPDEIIDFATLTGACMTALGNVCAGLMGNDQDLIERIKQSASRQGELLWQLPLYDEYKEGLKSTIADLINAGSGGKAGAQNGALFIAEFVGKQKDSDKHIPWAHIDIAGPCWFDQDMDWSPKGASGIPVRTILDYINQIV